MSNASGFGKYRCDVYGICVLDDRLQLYSDTPIRVNYMEMTSPSSVTI